MHCPAGEGAAAPELTEELVNSMHINAGRRVSELGQVIYAHRKAIARRFFLGGIVAGIVSGVIFVVMPLKVNDEPVPCAFIGTAMDELLLDSPRFSPPLHPYSTGEAASATDKVPGADNTREWKFFFLFVTLLMVLDVVLRESLPDNGKMRVAMLMFWFFVALAFWSEVLIRFGAGAGRIWAAGYAAEFLFALPNIVVNYWLLSALAVPDRLLPKLTLVLYSGAFLFRVAFSLGPPLRHDCFAASPLILGATLVYSGARILSSQDPGNIDWLQTPAARAFKVVLGHRLAEFYDEQDEAVFVWDRGQWRLTLLGLAIACLFGFEFGLARGVALRKQSHICNLYINLSSSALALFTLRALLVVSKDVFAQHMPARGLGWLLIYLGAEMLLSEIVEISAVAICFGAVIIFAVSSACSHEYWAKKRM